MRQLLPLLYRQPLFSGLGIDVLRAHKTVTPLAKVGRQSSGGAGGELPLVESCRACSCCLVMGGGDGLTGWFYSTAYYDRERYESQLLLLDHFITKLFSTVLYILFI